MADPSLAATIPLCVSPRIVHRSLTHWLGPAWEFVRLGTPGSVLVRDDVPDDYDGSYASGFVDALQPLEVHANEPYCRPAPAGGGSGRGGGGGGGGGGGSTSGQLAVLVEGPLDKEAVFLRACEQAGPGFTVREATRALFARKGPPHRFVRGRQPPRIFSFQCLCMPPFHQPLLCRCLWGMD